MLNLRSSRKGMYNQCAMTIFTVFTKTENDMFVHILRLNTHRDIANFQ